MEKYLKKRKLELQVLDSIADLVRVLDSNEKVVFVNKSMEELLGYDSERKICSLGDDLFNPDITRRALRSGEVIQREENIGNTIFSVKCSPIYSKEGKILGVVEVFRNVTMARKLQKEITEKNRFMTEETMAASIIQQKVLPAKGFIKNIKLDYLYMPSNILSGDMFDVFEIDEDNVVIYIADSVGHGFASSMVTMYIKTVIRSLEYYTLISPKDTLNELCESFTELSLELENYFTCFYGVYNRKEGKFTYSNAGHQPLPFLLRDDKTIELEAKGYPISRFAQDPEYEERVIEVMTGDKLFFMSDGVIEARNSDKEPFGIKRVKEIFKGNNRDYMDILKNQLYYFIGGSQIDDITALLINIW